ncbi:hypothetical protein PT015_11960 [Candidatus Mycobacterium wuenschmannii]|uniref:Secreted protein n=1 Tax=Candidatus Mycobacterium wuenschmannii TaxID=3027808 RepID=A0ABY8W8H2_9MYCO|nr:hypothetical protein [Candidatus Mycobacterium wuenschmannii]WIM90069.1 hypothetical protein PT015_11960 [Candidatus Mycobacterium wuenschmannii]
MTWTAAKIAVTGVLAAIPIAAVCLSASAVADPPDDPNPGPAPVHQGEYYNPNDYNDWWYNHSADGGGGGG